MPSISQRFVAELFGTFWLVFGGVVYRLLFERSQTEAAPAAGQA
jgi:glycerol uptake facilitator-like aquaporin